MIIHQIEQNTEEWHELRAGIPTASEFSRLVTTNGAPTTKQQSYFDELAAGAYTKKKSDKWNGNAETERGHELEADAIAKYEFLHDVSIERVGFVTTDDHSCGCSPDGLVGDDGMIEIKSLIQWRFVEMVRFVNRNKKVSAKYFIQPQGQMMICERKWCDLVFYNPDFPLLVVRQFPNLEFLHDLKTNIIVANRERDKRLMLLEKML